MSHTCNAYCGQDTHCDTALADASYTAADVRRVLGIVWWKATFLRVVEAREADISTLEKNPFTCVTPDGRRITNAEADAICGDGPQRAWLFWWTDVPHTTEEVPL